VRAFLIGAAVAVALTACGRDFFDPTPGGTTAPPGVQLIGRNIRMVAGAASAIRVSFTPKDPSVRIRLERSSTTGRVIACPLRTIDDALPAEATCLPDLPDGVREPLTLAGLGAVALVREGDPITIDLLLDFEGTGRSFAIHIPAIPVPVGTISCKDNACNPIFEVSPSRGGALRASASWGAGEGKLELLAGRVLAKSFSSTGIPYGIAATATGQSPQRITAQLSAPSEYALALSNAGAVELTEIRIDATWP
jgi:hypothetical protein